MSVTGDQLLSLLQTDHFDQVVGGAASLLGGTIPIPTPGFCVKTRDERGTKVFINVCTSSTVPLPSTWPRQLPSSSPPPPLPSDLKTYLTTGDLPPDAAQHAQQALAFPMHISFPREDLDHQGEPCTILDCVVNPQALHAATDFRPLKMFLIQLALGELEKKLDIQLDPHFKLPKMRCKGEIEPLPLPEISLLSSAMLESQSPGSNNPADKAEIRLQIPGQTPSSTISYPGINTTTSSKAGLAPPARAVQLVQELDLPSTSSTSTSTAPINISTTVNTGASGGGNNKGKASFHSGEPRQLAQGQTQGQGPSSSSPSSSSGLVAAAITTLRHAVRYEGRPAQGAVLTIQIPRRVLEEQGLVENPTRISIQIRLDLVEVFVPGCAPVTVQLPLAVRTEGAAASESESAARGSAAASKAVSSAVLSKKERTLVVKLPFMGFKEIGWRKKERNISSTSVMEIETNLNSF